MRESNPNAEKLIDRYFPVLDHGFVALVDYMGSDESIVRAARVSYGKGTKEKRDGTGLINYLVRNRHTSPLEMVEFVFHLAMPIFVARQHVRHRTASLNEYSARYSEIPEVYYTPEQDRIRGQGTHNKQGSSDEVISEVSPDLFDSSEAFKQYQSALESGVSRELSRIVTPVSTYTQMYWKMDLHNLLHYLKLRMDPHAQWEIRKLAEVMAGVVKEVCPVTYEAFDKHVLNSVSFSREEQKMLFFDAAGSMGNFKSTAQLSESEEREYRRKLNHLLTLPAPVTLDTESFLTPDEAMLRFFGEDQS